MTQEIYVAIATYAPESDVPSLVALGVTSQLAASALEALIADTETPDQWIAEQPELHGVAQPDVKDLPFWTAFTEEERSELISIQEEELRDCTKDVAVEMLQDQDEETLRDMLEVDSDDALSDDT